MMKNNKLLPFVVLLLALLACKMPNFSSGNSSSNGSSTGGTTGGSQGTATGGSDPKADVIAASRKFIELDSFTANMQGEGQTPINSKVEYKAPDRFRIKYLGGGPADGMEMVVIGKDMYMKTGDKWTKMPGSGNIPNLRDSFTEEGLKSLNDVKYEGDETVDGKQTSVYSYKNVTPVGSYPFSCKIWVRHDKGIPMKIFVEYSNGALKNMTVNYDVDTPVQIDPPVTK